MLEGVVGVYKKYLLRAKKYCQSFPIERNANFGKTFRCSTSSSKMRSLEDNIEKGDKKFEYYH